MKNKIGCSIPFNYLTGVGNREFESVFGSPDECLSLLRSKGVESIELRSVSNDVSAELLLKSVEKLRGFDMNVTIHGVLPDPASGQCDMPAIFSLPTDVESIVTVHAYAGENHGVDWYARQTVSSLRILSETAPSNITFALEVNRKKPPCFDPGDSYRGVLEIIQAVDSERVGVCWDFGHSESNVRNGFSDRIPPMDFIGSVIHTHIHDLSENGTTHFPLTFGNLLLREYIEPLLNEKYAGCLNLEFGVDRWTNQVDEKREAFIVSIDKLSVISGLRI